MTQDTQNASPKETQIDAPVNQARHVKPLLAIVIMLGILLIAGLVLVIGTIIKRFNNPQAAARAMHGFGAISIQVPQDARIVNIQAENRRLVLHLQDKEGNFLLLLDMRSGVELGRIRLSH